MQDKVAAIDFAGTKRGATPGLIKPDQAIDSQSLAIACAAIMFLNALLMLNIHDPLAQVIGYIVCGGFALTGIYLYSRYIGKPHTNSTWLFLAVTMHNIGNFFVLAGITGNRDLSAMQAVAGFFDIAMMIYIGTYTIFVKRNTERLTRNVGYFADLMLLLIAGGSMIIINYRNEFFSGTEHFGNEYIISSILLMLALAIWVMTLISSVFVRFTRGLAALQIFAGSLLLCAYFVPWFALQFNVSWIDSRMHYSHVLLQLAGVAIVLMVGLSNQPLSSKLKYPTLLATLRYTTIVACALATPVAGWMTYASGQPIPIFMFLLLSTACFVGLSYRSYTLLNAARKREKVLRDQADHDALTGVLNHRGFLAVIRQLQGAKGAMIFVDLNDFKSINDSYGHDVGNELLIGVARELSQISAELIVARLGGDEFACLLNSRTQSSIEDISNEIKTRLSRWFVINNDKILVSASIGTTDVGRINQEMLKAADAAMYRSKRRKHGLQNLPETPKSARSRQKIRETIAPILDNGEIYLHYQPIISLQTNESVGIEVLSRILVPGSNEILMPDSFIPVITHDGAFHQFITAVIRSLPEPDLFGHFEYISINISPLSLESVELCQTIDMQLNAKGYDSHQILFEITEESDWQRDSRFDGLTYLQDRGYRFAIDDYGAGYSCVGRLASTPAYAVKFDRSMLLAAENGVEAALESSIALAHRVGARAIVEGVENLSQLRMVQSLGARYVQGFLFGKPMPLEHLLALTPIAAHPQTLSVGGY